MEKQAAVFQYITPEKLTKLKQFTTDKDTPCLVIDLERVKEKYDELASSMPEAKIYYAVKASPLDEVVELLAKRGSYFDVASRYEVDQLLALGIEPKRMSFGNTIKKEADIAYIYEKGIRVFATDAESDLEKLARSAPGAAIIFRILLEDEGGEADWPLSRKFGADPEMIFELIKKAKTLGLKPEGLSFHVGSQQRDVKEWDKAIAVCKELFDKAAAEGIELRSLNLGGGFPARYINPTAPTQEYADEIKHYLQKHFGENWPEIMVEPGRSLVGDSGVIISEVVLVAKKAKDEKVPWVYLDAGKFNGLIESLDESIKYPIFVEGKETEEETMEVILAGPTCDSCDTMYEEFKYKLPKSIADGDRVYIFTAGAYTLSYASINFNGFPPLKPYILPED